MKKHLLSLVVMSFIISPVYADDVDYKALYQTTYAKLKTLGIAKTNEQYVFTPEELSAVAKIGVGQPLEQRFAAMLQQLKSNHPNVYMAPEVTWIFNQAGNVIGEIAIVYASTHEYVAFFGSPIGSGGFSGRYPKADVWDIMIDGKMQDFKAGSLQPETYANPGDIEYLPRGEGKGLNYIGSTWMIDYARGDLISMFPFGIIAPAMFQTLDYKTAADTLGAYIALVLHNPS